LLQGSIVVEDKVVASTMCRSHRENNTVASIEALCDQIVSHLTKLGIQTANAMLPGLTEKAILSMTAELPFALPRSVIELYKWSAGNKPGAEVDADFYPIPNFGMDPLSEVIETYKLLSVGQEYPRFHCGAMRWFPIFRNGGTDFYGICCRDDAAEDGEIVYDDNEGKHRDCVTPPPIVFVGFEAMLRTALCCYETGVYYIGRRGHLTYGINTYDDEGYLVSVDQSEFKKVARQFNPGVKYWE
jgi:hypothetical protein